MNYKKFCSSNQISKIHKICTATFKRHAVTYCSFTVSVCEPILPTRCQCFLQQDPLGTVYQGLVPTYPPPPPWPPAILTVVLLYLYVNLYCPPDASVFSSRTPSGLCTSVSCISPYCQWMMWPAWLYVMFIGMWPLPGRNWTGSPESSYVIVRTSCWFLLLMIFSECVSRLYSTVSRFLLLIWNYIMVLLTPAFRTI